MVSADSTATPEPVWVRVGKVAAMFAACVGVGRFVYTPILPLMSAEAGLSSDAAGMVATANYVGYLVGALLAFLAPALVRSRAPMRICAILLVLTLTLMPMTTNPVGWAGLRALAGVVTAVMFIFTVDNALAALNHSSRNLTGWAFGGVGAGIILSGTAVLIVSAVSDWRAAWWTAAVLALVFSAAGWNLEPARQPPPRADPIGRNKSVLRWFWVLFASYSLEGIGYIVAGTFLVAAMAETLPSWLASGTWIIVGMAALPSAVIWMSLASRFSLPALLFAALLLQSLGMALFPLFGGFAAALAAAALFGVTFVAISLLAVAMGAQSAFPRSVAILTAGYSLGQILGPIIVSPLLAGGYRDVLLWGAAIVAAAALAAGALALGTSSTEHRT